MLITKQEVVDFKQSYCNENNLIIELFLNSVFTKLQEPILDVGAGLGDIATNGFPNQRVLLLDVLDYSNFPVRTNHHRHCSDFFQYNPKDEQIGTLLLAHVLQFLDDDIPRLADKIDELNPSNIVIVANKNNDFMGLLIKWFNDNLLVSNPEVLLGDFPPGYFLVEKREFQAELVCPSYPVLVEQVCYLMDVEVTPQVRELITPFLVSQLSNPKFTINEEVSIFSRKVQK